MLHPTILHDVGPTILASFEDLNGYISDSFRALKISQPSLEVGAMQRKTTLHKLRILNCG